MTVDMEMLEDTAVTFDIEGDMLDDAEVTITGEDTDDLDVLIGESPSHQHLLDRLD